MPETKKEVFINADALRKELCIPQDVVIPEFQEQIVCTRSEIIKLKKDYESSKTDKVKSEEIISNFVISKKKITTATQVQTKELKVGVETSKISEEEQQKILKINEYMTAFSIKGVKESLEYIEKIEDRELRGFTTNFLLGSIEANGYQVHIECDEMKVIPTFGKQQAELELVLNNYTKKDKFRLDNFKTAILYRTSHMDNYIAANTDTDNNLLPEKINGDSYYEFLLKKYNIDNVWFLTVNDIKKNPNISPKDKSFLISYKEGAYKDYDISHNIKQYDVQSKRSQEAVAQMMAAHTDHPVVGPAVRRITEKRDLKDVGINLVRDPFGETFNIMTNAGPIGGLAILAAIIYSLWNHPKNTILAIAALGVAKGTGLLDKLADGMEGGAGLNGAIDSINGVIVGGGAVAEGQKEKLTPSQAAATEKVRANTELTNRINKFSEKSDKKGQTDDYLRFINSTRFQEKSLEKLLYPDSREVSIFSNSHSIDVSLDIPGNLDPLMLKQVLRVYLGMDYKLSIPADGKQPGDAEFSKFEAKYLPKKREEKNKSFSALLNVIYSKKS